MRISRKRPIMTRLSTAPTSNIATNYIPILSQVRRILLINLHIFHFQHNIKFNVINCLIMYYSFVRIIFYVDSNLWKGILCFPYMKKRRHVSDNICKVPRQRNYTMLYITFWKKNRSAAIKRARITGELKKIPPSSKFSTSTAFVR